MSLSPAGVDAQVRLLQDSGLAALAARCRVGLEKESLRVSNTGSISQRPHPTVLGSALTHPYITTDYSEALLELVTPAFSSCTEALSSLQNLHTYVLEKLDDEYLWATSMPCVLAGEQNIPIAEYGSSNPGLMKHVYRVGLGHRYGRVMQVIAGVHYNFSLDEAFWPEYQAVLGDPSSPRDFVDAHYMGMVRNIQRLGWLVPYLFGASPAVCKSFFSGKEPDLLIFDDTTYYEPYATSLRMGDIGYQNRKEEGIGIKACYHDLDSYVRSLAKATQTPCPVWEQIGVKVDGEYRQLNANQLQIENEYYSSVRPKQIPEDGETVSRSLLERGIRYVELRSLDVNAYHPLGIDEEQMRFLHLFMLYCLLRISPPIGAEERKEIDRNILWVATQGRDPQLKLQRGGKAVLFAHWMQEVLQAMIPVAELLDKVCEDSAYVAALRTQLEKSGQPEMTPSGRMLREMREQGEGFYACAHRLSKEQRRYFAESVVDPDFRKHLDALAVRSLEEQARLEANHHQSFDDYLQWYFNNQIKL